MVSLDPSEAFNSVDHQIIQQNLQIRYVYPKKCNKWVNPCLQGQATFAGLRDKKSNMQRLEKILNYECSTSTCLSYPN